MDCFVENHNDSTKLFLNPYKGQEYLYWKDKLKEVKCCTVVALASVTNQPLEKCFEYMEQHGRKPRKGMYVRDWSTALESMTKFKVKKGPYSQKNRITVKRFIEKHPEGKYYVANNGHAFVIDDGVVVDHTHGLRRQITCAYRVYTLDEYEQVKLTKKESFVKEVNPLSEFDKGIFFAASLLYSHWGCFDQTYVLIEQACLCDADISSLDEYDRHIMVKLMNQYPDKFRFKGV